MGLKEKIKEDLHQAMRAKDAAHVGSLRMLQAAIQRREVDERIALDDAQILAVIDKLVKQSREAVEQFARGGRADLVAKENQDIAVWQKYLPQPLTEGEIEQVIGEAIAVTGAASVKDMGKVMGHLKPKLQGRADMSQIGGRVRSLLGG